MLILIRLLCIMYNMIWKMNEQLVKVHGYLVNLNEKLVLLF